MKKLYFNKQAEKEFDKWPADVIEMVNTELDALCLNRTSNFGNQDLYQNDGKITRKPLKTAVGDHAMQLSIKHEDSYRVIYVAVMDDCVDVLHCFKKQKEGVQKADMETAKQRYKRLYSGH